MEHFYEVTTIDGDEFDYDYFYASVIDSRYDDAGRYIIITKIPSYRAPSYEDTLSQDSAVIAWKRLEEEGQ